MNSENDEVLAEVPEDGAETGVESSTGESLEDQLAAANAKIDEHWDRILRMQAEEDNLRKRHKRELENAHKFGADSLVRELLPVKDSLEMGLSAAAEAKDVAAVVEGIGLTDKMFADALQKIGVCVIAPEQGDALDPECHQAMSLVESAEQEPNTIVNVVQKGYTLNERVIRPAMVMVAKAKD